MIKVSNIDNLNVLLLLLCYVFI